MARLTSLLTTRGSFAVPEPLDRAWTWMEDQGWGYDHDGIWCLIPEPDRTGSTFADQVRLPDAFADVDHDRLTPIAVITHSGDVAAMWRDDNDGVQFVALGADGDTLTLAETPIDFLRLVAVDWPAAFRDWVETTFDVEVPDRWTAPDNDEFTDWIAAVQNDDALTEPDELWVRVDPARVIALAEKLLHTPYEQEPTDRTIDGIAVTTTPQCHLVPLIRTGDFADDADGSAFEATYERVGPAMEALEDAALESWGEPQMHQVADVEADHSYLDQVLLGLQHEEAAVWLRDGSAIVLCSGQGDQGLPLVQDLLICPTATVDAPVQDQQPTGTVIDDLVAGTPLADVREHARLVNEQSEVTAVHHVDGTVRYGWTDGAGAVTAWWFTPDERAMLLVFDHESELSLYGLPDDFDRQEALYDGVPADLVALARNRDADEQLLLNCADGDETIHAATGIFFCVEERWFIADGLLRELSRRDLTLADTGLAVGLAPYDFVVGG